MMTLEDCHRSNSHQDRARKLRREMTLPERSLWYALRDRRLAAWKFRRQSPIGPYIVDFFCHAAGLVLEFEADRTRQAELEAQGLRVLRVSNDDILYHMEAVLNAILGALAGDGEPPAPGLATLSPRERVGVRGPIAGSFTRPSATLSPREGVGVRGPIAGSFTPHPAFGHPLPQGEGKGCQCIRSFSPSRCGEPDRES